MGSMAQRSQLGVPPTICPYKVIKHTLLTATNFNDFNWSPLEPFIPYLNRKGFPCGAVCDSYVDAPYGKGFLSDGCDRLLSYVRPVYAAL